MASALPGFQHVTVFLCLYCSGHNVYHNGNKKCIVNPLNPITSPTHPISSRQKNTMKDQPVTTLSNKVILTAVVLLAGTAFHVAYDKTVYNITFASVEGTFNSTFCFTGSCKDKATVKLGSTIFWCLTVAAEPLGAIPGYLTGRKLAESAGTS